MNIAASQRRKEKEMFIVKFHNNTDALSVVKRPKYPYMSRQPFTGQLWGSHKDWD